MITQQQQVLKEVKTKLWILHPLKIRSGNNAKKTKLWILHPLEWRASSKALRRPSRK